LGINLYDQAADQREKGHLRRALILARHALRLLELGDGPDSPDVANVSNYLAAIYQDLGRYSDAESAGRRSVGIMEKHAADPDASIQTVFAQSLDGLGTTLRLHAQYEEGEGFHRRAIAAAESAFGLEDLSLASYLNNLAVLYKFWGKFEHAEGLYWRAAAIYLQRLGPECVEMATIYHNLGGLEHSRGNNAR